MGGLRIEEIEEEKKEKEEGEGLWRKVGSDPHHGGPWYGRDLRGKERKERRRGTMEECRAGSPSFGAF